MSREPSTVAELADRLERHGSGYVGALRDTDTADAAVLLRAQRHRIEELEALTTTGHRRTDPDTSKEAWELTDKTRTTNRGRIVQHFIDNPGTVLTAEQIEHRTGVRSAWKRVSELVKLGWLDVAGTADASTGMSVRTYRLAPMHSTEPSTPQLFDLEGEPHGS